MVTSIADFESQWRHESELTRRVFAELTDECLAHPVTPGCRTLGRLAWHITTTIPHIMAGVGLPAADLREDTPLPVRLSAADIRRTYDEVSAALLREVSTSWTDEMLETEDSPFGKPWKKGFTLMELIHHEIHHRGQMTVLMREAGLRVPSIYGPAREDWAAMGLPEPAV